MMIKHFIREIIVVSIKMSSSLLVKILLIIGLITTVVYVIAIVTDADRYVMVNYYSSMQDMIENYRKKPKIKLFDGSNPDRRVVILLECENGLCSNTLKSILDQSVKVDDIAVETNHPEKISNEEKRIVTVHKSGTAPMRETERDTIMLYLKNGKFYPYDYIEQRVARFH